MKDYVEIGSVPSGEDCQQVGTDNYDVNEAKRECKIFLNQLRRQLGDEPMTAQLKIAGNPHDFGNYYEVRCVFDDNDEEGMEYAFKCENEMPEFWDDIAKKELKEKPVYNFN